MPLRNMPIQRKVMTVMLVTSGVVLLLTCATFLVYEFVTFRQTTVQQLASLSRIIAANSTAALAFDDRESAQEIMASLQAEPTIAAASLYDQDGSLFAYHPADQPPSAFPDAPGDDEGYRFGRGYLHRYQPVVQGTQWLGTLYLQSDMRPMYARLRLYGGIVLLVFAASLLMAYGLARTLQRQISRPILALAETARAVSDRRDYSVRAPKMGQDELGLLTDAFNHMLTQTQARTKALRAQEKQFRQVVESSPNGIVMINVREEIVLVNTQTEFLFDYHRDEVLGQPIQLLIPHWPGDPEVDARDAASAVLEAPLGTGSELAGRKKGGRRFPVELGLASIETERGPEVLISIVDITERKQAEQRLIAAKEEAETMNRLKSAFLANMSHEIRTPLTAILGFASLLAERVDPKNRPFAERIASGGQRLMDTLNAVLSLAQLEADNVAFEREPVEVAHEVQEALALLERQAQQKGLTLAFKLDPGTDRVKAPLDRGAFSSILHNVIGNAIKYTAEGHIMVTLTHDAKHVILDVEDTGVGIDPAFLTQIFEPFQQESTGWNRAHEGVGLGLSITKRLVEHMDGQITATSVKGQGSRFTISFPRAPEHQQPALADPDEQLSAASSQKNTQVQILVVEDNADTRLLLRALLDEVGEVHLAANAQEALDRAREHLNAAGGDEADRDVPFDLVLLDINLGEGPDGIEVLKSLRTMPRFRDVPVAAVTGYAMPGDRERLLKEGFDAYLAKPFQPDDLHELTARFLRSA